MGNFSRDVLYNLNIEGHESCFLAFDPCDYTEVRQYSQNPAFESDCVRCLLPLANEAVKHFTRNNEDYALELELRFSRVKQRRQKQLEKEGKLPLPAFSIISQQAFKRSRDDFEEIVCACSEALQNILDGTYSDESFVIKDGYKTKSGHFYTCPNLMAGFALWKLDRAIIAIKSGWVSETASLLVDVHHALSLAKIPHAVKLYEAQEQRKISERNATAGSNGPKKQEEYKADAIELYFSLGKETPWKSMDAAADKIYGLLLEKYKDLIKVNDHKKSIISENQADDTMVGWFKDADPMKNFIKK